MSPALLAAIAALGLALVVVGILSRGREQDRELAAFLDLPFGERDVPVTTVTDSTAGVFAGTVDVAGRIVEQFDAKGDLRKALERAQVPLRPEEFVGVVVAAGGVGALALWVITQQILIGLTVAIATPLAGRAYLTYRVAKRRKKFQAQLPDALSLIASSLSSGHTFLRSIQMMCTESEQPLADEFARVVHETQLGDPLVDALERMALRLQIRDLDWVVQAVRIQQTVGGKLADLLHTVAEFIRAREEVRREVQVLTAEGRISAWVLGGMPVFLLLAIATISPGYMDPMFEGWGLVVLGALAASVAVGMAVITKMVKIEV